MRSRKPLLFGECSQSPPSSFSPSGWPVTTDSGTRGRPKRDKQMTKDAKKSGLFNPVESRQALKLLVPKWVLIIYVIPAGALTTWVMACIWRILNLDHSSILQVSSPEFYTYIMELVLFSTGIIIAVPFDVLALGPLLYMVRGLLQVRLLWISKDGILVGKNSSCARCYGWDSIVSMEEYRSWLDTPPMTKVSFDNGFSVTLCGYIVGYEHIVTFMKAMREKRPPEPVIANDYLEMIKKVLENKE